MTTGEAVKVTNGHHLRPPHPVQVALRKRADELEAEADAAGEAFAAEPRLRFSRPPEMLRMLAGEFRAIASHVGPG